MKIADLNSAESHVHANGTDSQRQKNTQQPSVEKNKPENNLKRVAEAVTPPSTDRIRLNKLAGVNDQSLAVAKKIRAVDQSMALVEEKVKEMRTFLEGVVKAYPPYPPGSSERVHALRQFSALRKQIDQLMVPPPEETSAAVKPIPEGAGQGSQSMNLPELSADAEDAELDDALNRLNDAYAQLHQQHKAFIDDAGHIIASLK